MSEGEPASARAQDAAGAPDAPPPGQSAGALLRQLREAAGIDAARLASALKVSPRKLQALESDRLDDLPNLTFARGLASSICRTLGADAAPVLALMPVTTPNLHVPDAAVNQRRHDWSERSGPALGSRPFRPLLIAAAVVLLAAAVLWLLPIQLGGAPSPEPAPPATEGEGMAPESAPPASAPAFAPASMPAPIPMPASAAPAAQAASAAAPVASAASAASAARAPASAASGAVSASAEGALLGLTATGETWVTVRDAAGQTLVNRALNAGQTLGVNGQSPLEVTVGRKDAIAVTVRGKPQALKSASGSSVAHFTVQ